MIDLFITTTNRPDLLRRSLESLRENTEKDLYRLTIVQDGNFVVTNHVLDDFTDIVDYKLISHDTVGLGPSINRALSHIDSMKRWEGPAETDGLTVYVQDDVQYSKNWLPTLAQAFLVRERQCKLGFASGIECVEHPVKKGLGNGIILKDWIRATCMLARHNYWMSMWPIPKIDPETGRERGRPHDGLGSGVDWWFIRNHPNSVCRTNRTNLVIPGLLQHLGYNKSTWLKRDLPESENDLKLISASEKYQTRACDGFGYGCGVALLDGEYHCKSCNYDSLHDSDAFK